MYNHVAISISQVMQEKSGKTVKKIEKTANNQQIRNQEDSSFYIKIRKMFDLHLQTAKIPQFNGQPFFNMPYLICWSCGSGWWGVSV